MRMFIILIGTLFHYSFAQDDSELTPFEYTKKIYQEVEEIKKINPQNYFKEIDQYRTKLEKYIDHKKRVCEGEFSFIILSGQNTGGEARQSSKKKLSKEEQILCYRELKALQITFINSMFVARKSYLDYLHEKRISELKMTRDDAVKKLNSQFNKKIPRSRN